MSRQGNRRYAAIQYPDGIVIDDTENAILFFAVEKRLYVLLLCLAMSCCVLLCIAMYCYVVLCLIRPFFFTTGLEKGKEDREK